MKVAALSLLAILACTADSSGYLRESGERRMSEENVESLHEAMSTLQAEEREHEDNWADLKRQYFEINGKELTDEEIDIAINEGRAEAGPRFGPNHKIRLLSKVPEFEDFEMPPQVINAEEERRLRRMQTQTTRSGKYFIIAGNSPGWEQNRGRNEFFCVSAQGLDRQNYLPRPGQKVALNNCLTTPGKLIAWEYTSDLELRMQNDGIYYKWCIETARARRDQKAEINTCDFFNGQQVWNLYNDDYTWRPGNNADLDLCMTSQDNPSDGGTIQLEKCEEQYNFASRRLGGRKSRRDRRHDRRRRRKKYYKGRGSNSARLRQVWIVCIDTDNCGITDFGYVKCNFVSSCQPGSPLK